jgi:hypothetical protein
MNKLIFKGCQVETGSPSILSLDIDPIDIPFVFQFTKLHKDIPLKVELRKWHRERTLSQNKLFHAVIGEIARNTGMHAELVKEGIKEQYGSKVIGWKGSTMPKPSSSCDTAEMGALIDGAILEAAELGIDVLYEKRLWDELRAVQ